MTTKLFSVCESVKCLEPTQNLKIKSTVLTSKTEPEKDENPIHILLHSTLSWDKLCMRVATFLRLKSLLLKRPYVKGQINVN